MLSVEEIVARLKTVVDKPIDVGVVKELADISASANGVLDAGGILTATRVARTVSRHPDQGAAILANVITRRVGLPDMTVAYVVLATNVFLDLKRVPKVPNVSP